jgi:hypothetical protein
MLSECVYVYCICVRGFIYSRKIDSSIFVELKYHYGFFRLCKECTIEHWNFCSQHKECASELYGVRKECAKRAHESENNSGEASRSLNTIEEKLCSGSTKKRSY